MNTSTSPWRLDRLLHPAVVAGANDSLVRARALAAALLWLFFTDVVLIPVAAVNSSSVAVLLLCAFLALFSLAGLAVLRTSRDPSRAATMINVQLLIGMALWAMFEDGATALWSPWWCVLPLVASYSGSARAGFAWAVVMLVVTSALAQLHTLGLHFPVRSMEVSDLRLLVLSHNTSLLVVGSVTWLEGVLRQRVQDQRVHLYRAVEERERLLDAVLESTSDLVAAVDTRGRIIKVNRNFQRFFGELAGLPVMSGVALAEVLPAQMRERLDRMVARLGEGDTIPAWTEKLTVDGRERWLEIRAYPIGDPAVLGLTLQARDVTSKVEIDGALKVAQQNLAHLTVKAGRADSADGVIHNVGNVVSSVTVGVSMLDERVRDLRLGSVRRVAELIGGQADPVAFLTADPRGARALALLGELGRHLADAEEGMFEQISALHRDVDHVRRVLSTQQDFARQRSRVQHGSVHDVIEAALLLQSASLSRHEIEVVRAFGALPDIPLDRDLVLQILVNLLTNAVQAMKSQDTPRRVTLSTAFDGDTVTVSVRDSGHGISAADLDRLFGHGFTTRPDGHGFGLSSSLACARELGGDLGARSEGEGRGAEFVLTLPCAQLREAAAS